MAAPKVKKQYVEEKVEVTDNYMPIKLLNTFVSDWKIKARVTKKAPIRTWNNAKGTGKILNIDLLDRQGTGIQATFFNDAAEKYNELIEHGKLYLFSNGYVKMANKRFTSINNDFCLTFDKRIHLEPCEEDDGAINAQSF